VGGWSGGTEKKNGHLFQLKISSSSAENLLAARCNLKSRKRRPGISLKTPGSRRGGPNGKRQLESRHQKPLCSLATGDPLKIYPLIFRGSSLELYHGILRSMTRTSTSTTQSTSIKRPRPSRTRNIAHSDVRCLTRKWRGVAVRIPEETRQRGRKPNIKRAAGRLVCHCPLRDFRYLTSLIRSEKSAFVRRELESTGQSQGHGPRTHVPSANARENYT
jgi:hypothetical protein